jgi:hypothetical protein
VQKIDQNVAQRVFLVKKYYSIFLVVKISRKFWFLLYPMGENSSNLVTLDAAQQARTLTCLLTRKIINVFL